MSLNEKIHLVPFNPLWETLYQTEALQLQKKLGRNIVDIQHIGSTSVPNIYAKPIIDIMIGIKDLEKSELVVQTLRELDYEYFGEANVPGRLYLRKRTQNHFNIALCRHNSEIWMNNILFRDYLRHHPEDATTYSLLKKKIFDSGIDTLLPYSENKHAFIEEILLKAKNEIH